MSDEEDITKLRKAITIIAISLSELRRSVKTLKKRVAEIEERERSEHADSSA